MEFRISFCTLLQKIAQALGWPPPIYSHVEVPLRYTIVVLPKGSGPLSLYFVGEPSIVLSVAADYATEEAVRYLVKKKYINDDDVNSKHNIQYKSLYSMYYIKRRELKAICKNASTARPRNQRWGIGYVSVSYRKTVFIDFWDLWVKKSVVFEIVFHDVETIIQPDLSYVCFFGVVGFNNSPKSSFFISTACSTIEKAKQELGKSDLKYYQPLYGFVVIHANYNKMLCTKFISSVLQAQYVLAKKRRLSPAATEEYIANGYPTLPCLEQLAHKNLIDSPSFKVNTYDTVDALTTAGTSTSKSLIAK